MVAGKDQLTQAMHSIHIWLLLGFLNLMIAGSCGCGARPSAPGGQKLPSSGDPKTDLQAAIEARDWPTAFAISQQAMIAYPGDADVLTNAAIATAQTGNRVEAAQLLVEAVRSTDYATSGGRIDNAVAALLDVGRLYEAIDLLADVVSKHPQSASYRRMLVGFYGEVQLTEEVDQHMAALFEQRQFDLPLLLATTETVPDATPRTRLSCF